MQYKTVNSNRNNSSDDDAEGFFNPNGSDFVIYSAQRKVLTNLHLDLDEEIQQPDYYRPFIRHLDNLEEHDHVSVHLKTEGGSYDGAVALIDAFSKTEATVTAFIDGCAYSAGSLIALSCPNIVVSPFARLMCHTARYGTGGSLLNVQKYSSFMLDHIHKTMQNVYKDFLTPDELTRVLSGEEFFFEADQISKRLAKKFKVKRQPLKK